MQILHAWISAFATFSASALSPISQQVQVSVDQDTVIPSTGALTGQVSAIYSYGKGVEGTVTLRLKREMLPWGCTSDVPEADAGVGFMPRLPDVDPKDCQPVLVELADAKLGPDGIYSFDMPLPDNLDTWGTLELEASVVEAATGELQPDSHAWILFLYSMPLPPSLYPSPSCLSMEL